MKNHIENKITQGERLHCQNPQAPFPSFKRVRRVSERENGGPGSWRVPLAGIAVHSRPARMRRVSRFGASYRFRCPNPLDSVRPRFSEFAALGFWTEARSDV
jgi:hypothetical protein